MDPRMRVTKGQQLDTLPMEAWNHFLRAGSAVLEQQALGYDDQALALANGTTIIVRNDSGADLPAFSVLKPGAPIISPATDSGEVVDRPNLIGAAPTDNNPKFIVTQEPIGASSFGRGRLAGLTWVQVNVTDSTHTYARPVAADSTKLVSNATTGVPIIWKEGGTGTKWAMVILLGSSAFASPLTTKGDVWGYSTTDARIPVGTNGQVLTADSAQTLGLKWATPASSGAFSGAKVRILGSQPIGAGSTPIRWGPVTFDTDSYFSSSSPTLFTVPVGGIYQVIANFTIFAPSFGTFPGEIMGLIELLGSGISVTDRVVQILNVSAPGGSINLGNSFVLTGLFQAAAGAQFRVTAASNYQGSFVDTNITGDNSFAIARLAST